MKIIQFFAQTRFGNPGLHVWSGGQTLADAPPAGQGPKEGWFRFTVTLTKSRPIGFKLFDRKGGNPVEWEQHERSIVIGPGGELPDRVWFMEGTKRVMLQDPFARDLAKVRIHLITARKYRDASLYVWTPAGYSQRFPLADRENDRDQYGPFYDLALDDRINNAFNFKFVRQEGGRDHYEGDAANRTWSSADGAAVWTHSEGADVLTAEPIKRKLSLHLRHEWGDRPALMHLWHDGSGFVRDVEGSPGPADGWLTFTQDGLYSGLQYGVMFTQDPRSDDPALWEDEAARRFIALAQDEEHFTLEGDSALFPALPVPDRQVAIRISGRDPHCGLQEADSLEVRVHKARAPLSLPIRKEADGTWLFHAYPRVITSFRFGAQGKWEEKEHRLQLPSSPAGGNPHRTGHVILGREPVLLQAPPATIFDDPPFLITRQGAMEQNGHLRFVFHAPWCARVRLRGEWMEESALLDMHSTTDGTFWWAQVPLAEVQAGLPAAYNGDYHGAWYQFVLNDPGDSSENRSLNGGKLVQDTAAGWVASPHPYGKSRLVNHNRYQWQSTGWQTPGWEYLQVYQLHASRFTRRHTDAGDTPLPPFLQIAREIEAPDGYIRQLGVTAILLLPINDFGDPPSWGYNPSYFYAIEDSYGGPDALKHLVDVCHRHGIAVLLDVELNHAGVDNNVIWENARETYLDGDTKWGRLINFDHPQCKHFFEQNLVYLSTEYRIDGFRFDHTKTIIDGHVQAWYILVPGSGGGWEFLHGLRAAVKWRDGNCLFMAEQLPNDWALTNYGGSMDTQWCDDFHDRIEDVCRARDGEMSRLAAAMQYSQTCCQQWYNVTNYSESHDEVGNEDDRMAHVAPYGCGLRTNKVVAAATILSRGIPLFFMGEESGETAQFLFGKDDALDLNDYENDINRQRVRAWWRTLIALRKSNPKLQGPAPLAVRFVKGPTMAFSRGEGHDYFVVLNFGSAAGWRNLGEMNLPDGTYKELWNSTWPDFQVEWEDEHANGGREARLHRGHNLQVPDYGAVILERI